MNCCDTYGNCTQGRDCPSRTGVVLHHQACHAARVANSYLPPGVQDRRFFPVDDKGECIAGFEPFNYPTVDLPIVLVGLEPDEPTEPTRPVCDCWPLTPKETNQIIAGMCFFFAVFVGAVAFGIGYGWVRFGRDLMAYLIGGAA